MKGYQKLLSTAALGAAMMLGAVGESDAAFCTAGAIGCTTTSSVATGTFLGLVSGGSTLGNSQPSLANIAELKLAAGEITATSQAVLLAKIDTDETSNGDFTNNGPITSVTSGTFTYTGSNTIDLLNVVLKGGNTAASVFLLTNVMPGQGFSWSTGQDLSNVQFVQAVPVPAALPLLGTALAGLGLVARKRRKTAPAAA